MISMIMGKENRCLPIIRWKRIPFAIKMSWKTNAGLKKKF